MGAQKIDNRVMFQTLPLVYPLQMHRHESLEIGERILNAYYKITDR